MAVVAEIVKGYVAGGQAIDGIDRQPFDLRRDPIFLQLANDAVAPLAGEAPVIGDHGQPEPAANQAEGEE